MGCRSPPTGRGVVQAHRHRRGVPAVERGPEETPRRNALAGHHRLPERGGPRVLRGRVASRLAYCPAAGSRSCRPTFSPSLTRSIRRLPSWLARSERGQTDQGRVAGSVRAEHAGPGGVGAAVQPALPALHEAALTPRRLRPEDTGGLRDAGIGVTNLSTGNRPRRRAHVVKDGGGQSGQRDGLRW